MVLSAGQYKIPTEARVLRWRAGGPLHCDPGQAEQCKDRAGGWHVHGHHNPGSGSGSAGRRHGSPSLTGSLCFHIPFCRMMLLPHPALMKPVTHSLADIPIGTCFCIRRRQGPYLQNGPRLTPSCFLSREAPSWHSLPDANGLSAQVVACEIEQFMRDFAQPYFERAGVSDKVMLLVLINQQMHLEVSCLMHSVLSRQHMCCPDKRCVHCCTVRRGIFMLE